MDAVEKILSTREDFSLQRMIEKVESLPFGGMPRIAPSLKWAKNIPELIKGGSVVYDDYCANDVYEQIVLYYRKRVEAYFSLMNGKLGQGSKEIKNEELQKIFEPLLRDWKYNPIRIDEKMRFHGSTIDAVFEAVKDSDAPLEGVRSSNR
jgi:hypothetical protein